jgi:hypothetical protein
MLVVVVVVIVVVVVVVVFVVLIVVSITNLQIARTSPLIKKCKGFAVWEARERLELNQDTLLAFEFPEHDVFYYRDNFLINPTAYQLLEDCVQNYASEMHYFLETVNASFFYGVISNEVFVLFAFVYSFVWSWFFAFIYMLHGCLLARSREPGFR